MTYSIETVSADVIAALAMRYAIGMVGYRQDLWAAFDQICGAISERDYVDIYMPLRDALIAPFA